VNRALMVNEAGEMARKRIERLVGEFAALTVRVTKIKYEILEGEKRFEEEDLRSENQKDRSHKGKEIVTINVDDEHQFWPFTGEYWRDELGYYRYKLANKCGLRGSPEGAPEPETNTPGTGGPDDGTAAPTPPSGTGAATSPDTQPEPGQ